MKLATCLFLLLLPLGVGAQTAKTDGHTHDKGGHSHAAPKAGNMPVLEKKTVPATAVSPEYIQLAKNVEIIPNIEKALKSSGVSTHEGIFGPLLFAEQTRSFLIELQPGMFLAEHPHDTGSIIYTVRGKWVLASEGKRHVMEAGTLFRFGDKMPTGWEAPFPEGALLLVVKTKKQGENYASFSTGINKMKATVEKEKAEGTAFYYNVLKPDHPAIVFARSVNPKFDDVLKNIKN